MESRCTCSENLACLLAREADAELTALSCAHVFHTKCIHEWSEVSGQDLMAGPRKCTRSSVAQTVID